jgi:hypothetical protein
VVLIVPEQSLREFPIASDLLENLAIVLNFARTYGTHRAKWLSERLVQGKSWLETSFGQQFDKMETS